MFSLFLKKKKKYGTITDPKVNEVKFPLKLPPKSCQSVIITTRFSNIYFTIVPLDYNGTEANRKIKHIDDGFECTNDTFDNCTVEYPDDEYRWYLKITHGGRKNKQKKENPAQTPVTVTDVQ